METCTPTFALHTHGPYSSNLNFNTELQPSLKKDLVSEISDIYRGTIHDLSSITPLELPSSPSTPGASSLLFLPLDFYETFEKFRTGIKIGDYTEVFSAFLRILGMPAHAICTVGIYLTHGVNFGILPKPLLLVIPILNIIGMITYGVELMSESIALYRQVMFGKKFNFSQINILQNLINNPDPITCNTSLYEVITYIETNQTLLEEKFEKEEIEGLLSSLKELKQKLEEDPYFRRLILQDYLPMLKKIAGMILYHNLDKIQKENLELGASEIQAIKTMANEKEKSLEEELGNALTLKWKHFARTVNPWFVKEANQKVVTILDELQKNHLNESEEALREGFEFMQNMEIQHKKRILVHILGIIALMFGIISLTAAFCGCPITSLVLTALIIGFGVSRMVVCKGTLDVKGWSFLFDNLFPDFLKKRLFKTPPEEELSAFYTKKKIIPITPIAPPTSPIHLTRLYA